MRRIFIILLLVHFTVFTPEITFAQSSKLKRADKLYNDFKFRDAIKIYKKVARKHPDNAKALEGVANSYRLLNNTKEAVKWYEKVVQLPDVSPINTFYYAQMLRSNEDYDDADLYYRQYAELAPDDPRGSTLAGSIDELKFLMQESPLYEVRRTNINTKYSEFGPAFYKSGIVFSSNRKQDSYIRRTDNWTENPFLQLYYTEQYHDGSFSEPVLFEGKQNGIYHEGPVAFNNPKSEMYLTRSNYDKKSSDNTIKLKLYKLSLRKGEWVNLQEGAPFNSNEYSVGLPSISKDGSIMYFTSDMPGGYGGSDIYMAYWEDNDWGQPINLGKQINTPGNELFPFIAEKGELYFSSDGHIGLGGLDIYFAEPVEDGSFSLIKNLGAPVNSSWDDFGIIYDPLKAEGFFSSNRGNNADDDDIYTFNKHDLKLEVLVVDESSGDPLKDAEVSIINIATEKGQIALTNSNGICRFEIENDKEYKLIASKDMPDPRKQYIAKSKPVSTKRSRLLSLKKETIGLELIEKEVPIVLKNIYYDYGKYYIREDAKPALDTLVNILMDNPTMEIELSAHTDSRSSDSFNLILSAKRAKTAVDYIGTRGVDIRRIKAVGYGETRLVNRCSNGVDCTEKEHQKNRRTEFKVLKF